jgi:hypothetical protein
MFSNNGILYIRAVLNNEKISTVVHAKDVNRNGVLSFSFVQIFREWIYLQSILSGSVFGTPYAPVQC